MYREGRSGYIFDYPLLVRLYASHHRVKNFEVFEPLFETIRRCVNIYPNEMNLTEEVFLGELEDVLYSDFEGWMVSLENETYWLTVMEQIEIDHAIPQLLRWYYRLNLPDLVTVDSEVASYNENAFILLS